MKERRRSVDSTSTISAGLAGNLDTFVAALNLELSHIARKSGFERFDWNSPERRISRNTFVRFLNALHTEARDDAVGLRYGQVYQFGNTGPLGYALLHAPALRDALEIHRTYQRLAADDPCFAIENGAGSFTVSWEIRDRSLDMAHYSDFWAILALRLVQHFAGDAAKPLEVRLARRNPRAADLHREIFRQAVSFNAGRDMLRFSGSYLDARRPDADPRLLRLMLASCATQLAALPRLNDLHKRVKERIRAELIVRAATLPQIARDLAMSERSLQRRLAELGTSFEQVLDETRRELSDQLLRNGQFSLCEISYRCGYSNASAYSRAARSWYGVPPAELRRRGNPTRN